MATAVPPRGPWPADLAIVGEAPGRDEEAYMEPFCGASGQELEAMLQEAGLDPRTPYYTNTFKHRPPDNKVEWFFGKKADPDTLPGVPPCGAGKYLKREYLSHLELLRAELALVRPRLILAMGNTAMWALTERAGIAKLRGVLYPTPYGTVLPTFHPAYILRQWASRPIAIADLEKARGFLDGDLTLPSLEDFSLHLNPKAADLPQWEALLLAAPRLAVDVETHGGQIRTVGFAIGPREAYVIPFWDPTHGNYWDNLADEVHAWRVVQRVMESSSEKVFQNGLYDLQYFLAHGIRPRGTGTDLMLKHHALQPEMQKGLGFLASVYLNQEAWKAYRSERDEEKADA